MTNHSKPTANIGGHFSLLLEPTVAEVHVVITETQISTTEVKTLKPYIQGVPKKNGTTVPLFYFCDNFRKWTPILTIFSPLEPDIYDA